MHKNSQFTNNFEMKHIDIVFIVFDMKLQETIMSKLST